MSETKTVAFDSVLEDMRAQIAALTARLAQLEQSGAPAGGPAAEVKAAVAPVPAAAAAAAPAEPEEISEEEILAISAALAAWFGVRVHIRQIRLISSRAWAQEGRVSIQASHRLHG